MNNKVWFVTGASKGLGLSLVKKLLAAGYRVAATSRNLQDLSKAVGADKKVFLPLSMDLVNENSVEKGIKDTIDYFGSIDVVVNNAGYGLAGSLEELSDAETRQNFDINVFGSLNVIRKVMPYLRKQQSGHIFNVSSIGGFTGSFPGFGIYVATKFAHFDITGKTISNDGMGIFELKNGKIINSQVLTDRLGFLQQIGALPADINTLTNKKDPK